MKKRKRPSTAGKFYFFLAQRQAERLHKVTNELEEAKELRLDHTVCAVCAGSISVKTRPKQLRRVWSRLRHGAEGK